MQRKQHKDNKTLSLPSMGSVLAFFFFTAHARKRFPAHLAHSSTTMQQRAIRGARRAPRQRGESGPGAVSEQIPGLPEHPGTCTLLAWCRSKRHPATAQ